MVEFLMIFPPIWSFSEPYIAIPSLISQLRHKGYSAKAMDINIDFFNDMLTKQELERSLQLIETKFTALKSRELEIQEEKTYEEKIASLKLNAFYHYMEHEKEKIKNIPNVIDEAVKIIKSPTDFYKPKKIVPALNILKLATKIISFPYYPLEINYTYITNKFMKLNYQDIKRVIEDTEQNIFLDYYRRYGIIEKIKKQEPKYIGISIGEESQLIGGLTLAKILKKETNAYINIGGNYFLRLLDSLKKLPDFFDTFADSVSYGEGENSILELAEFITGKRNIENVSNLVYKKDQEVISTKRSIPVKLSEINKPDFSDFIHKSYFTPEIILPVQATRGCYWGKCTFCDSDYNLSYSIKDIGLLIQELKYYKNEYNINHIEFIDEAISPSYLDKLSKEIIKDGLKINICFLARLEKEFTKDLLIQLYKAGVKCITWGYESENERILKLINKGIDIKNRKKILYNANKAGIWNRIYAFIGFPTETYKESMQTINFLFKNKLVNSFGFCHFRLGRHSKIAMNYEKYNISVPNYQDDFVVELDFSYNNYKEDEAKKIEENIAKYQKSNIYKKKRLINSLVFNFMFLYVAKYGTNYLKKVFYW